MTSLYVTHDQVEAMTMADRMIVMNDGISEQIGTPLEVYEQPQTLFSAQFIGSPAMNMLKGTAQDRTVHLDCGASLSTTSNYRGDVWVGIRPEHLERESGGPLQFAVKLVEPLGANTLLHGEIVDGQEPLTACLPGVHVDVAQAAPLRFSVPADHIHLFDRSSGHRVN